ncbi:MAG: Unknown protein [uncultured Sulfurovum sp.]|uniref:Uncharacterized protein n=1 Tax=uncultured Sulfurovum sp. TaxID=269237 RepID=A0A6S6TZ27_9BACT|nr:MAG: Unknown protein [uncultured Sulfurovum sp.]
MAPNTIDKEFSFVLEDNESESTESLITKINNQKSTIFTKNYLSSLSRKDAGRLIDEGMYERYDEFDKRLSSFILTIQQTLDSGNSLTSRDKLKLVEYEEKLQILNRIKNITEDLMVIHNSSKENNTQVYNDSKDHEALGNRNIAFGHHENLTYKDIVILNPNQFVSISGGGNHPKEAIANTNKIKLNSISDEEVEKIKQAKSIAKKYRDILILVPGSTEGNDQFREGEQQQRTNNENGSITERGMQDAERRAFRYFDKNLKTGVKNELLKNSTDQLSKEEETEIQIQLKKAIQENDRIPVEHKDDRFNTTLPKELSNALKEKKEELASLEINNELSKVEGNVHLYSQMTPCEFCAGVKTTLGTTFSSLKITIKSGVKYKL